MLMDVANELKRLNYYYLAAHSAKGIKKPTFWEVPDPTKPKPPTEESMAIGERGIEKAMARLAERD